MAYEYDNIANCLPPGVPAMMSAAYGMEIMQDEQKITIFSEHQDAMRRIFLDGRKPSAQVLADPTYAGYSTGRWEGDTLIVDTVALTTKSYIDGSSPHSDKMTVQERLRFIEPGVLENQIVVTDPEALVVNLMPAPTAEALEAELAEAEAEAGIEREEAAPAEAAAGEGDVVAEPQDQGSGESVAAADADS